MRKRVLTTAVFLGALVLLLSLPGLAQFAQAAPGAQENPPDPNLSISDEVCLGCHGVLSPCQSIISL